MTTRTTTDGPWCWQSKAARRKIREACDKTNNVATALCVYDALTEIASDEGKETFQTTHAWVQRISGLSPRTIGSVLQVLAEIGLVSISTPALRAPSTYTLLPFGNGCLSFGNGCGAFGNSQKWDGCRDQKNSEENQKNSCPDKPGGKAKAKRPRPRNELLDALAGLDGSNPDKATDPAWGKIATALSQIKAVSPDVTPDEIRRRADRYRSQHPTWHLSANALANHWGALDGPAHVDPPLKFITENAPA